MTTPAATATPAGAQAPQRRQQRQPENPAVRAILWGSLIFLLALIINQVGFGQGIGLPAQRVPYLFIEVVLAVSTGMAVYAVSQISAISNRIAEIERQTRDALTRVMEAAVRVEQVIKDELAAMPSADDLRELRTRLDVVPEQIAALEERINVLQGLIVEHRNLPHDRS